MPAKKKSSSKKSSSKKSSAKGAAASRGAAKKSSTTAAAKRSATKAAKRVAATARAGARRVQATASQAAGAVKRAAKGKSATQLTAIAVGAVAATAAAVAAGAKVAKVAREKKEAAGRPPSRLTPGKPPASAAPKTNPPPSEVPAKAPSEAQPAKAAPASKSAPLKATVAKEKPSKAGGDAKIGVPSKAGASRDGFASREPNPYKFVGTRSVRPDGLDKVTGRARFAADMKLPGMLYGQVLRSPHAHAKIVSIDTKAALAMPGVKAVITRDDFPEFPVGNPMRDTAYNLMARDRVHYEGQTVAAVAATTRRQAREAAAAIKVNYEVLPQVMTVDEAMAEGAVLLNEGMMTRGQDPAPTKPSNVAMKSTFKAGDLDAGFAEADVVVEGDFITKPVHQGYIEPHAVVADSTQEDKAVVWCSSQGHFRVQQQTAGMLGWQPSQVKVLPAEIGGGFGGKTTIYLEPLAVLLSRKANRPVKIVMGRDEVFRATGPASGTHIKVKLGAKKDGTLVAGKAWMAYECGPFGGFWGMVGAWCVFAPYRIPNYLVESFEVCVNKPVNIAYRAPAAPPAAFATETLLDQIAERLGIDQIEIRLRNAVKQGDPSVQGPPYPVHGLKETLEAIRDSPQYKSKLTGKNQGRGVATGYWFNIGEASSATVNLAENGTAIVLTGSPDIGGSRASMALIAAEELGIDVDRIKPGVADTDSVGYTDTTEGSRTTYATGWAVVEACRAIVTKMRERAAKMWSVDVSEVEWKDGAAVHTKGANEPLPLAKITAKSKSTGGPLTASASLTARGAGPGFCTQVFDVEVDPETGFVKVLRVTTAQDAGRAIHPSYVEGQMQGGVVQGLGWALNEEYIHNKKGVMDNPSFLDYRVPVASDLPMIETIIVEVPNPVHPYGVRGVGEVGIVPPIPAIANAIARAVGVRIQELPMSPVRVLDAINKKKPATRAVAAAGT
jgi:CO/xanthine dehydrogenase Mo-binding subunit